jgi:polyhydroxyalkanoate synthesis repressor PhaR
MNAETSVEIRRYPNRRLYDRSRRQYVTLQDVETMVLEGTNVEVRDSRTGEDLTRQVLTQILMERHPQKMDMFPVAMLHSILRANEVAVALWRGYMRQSLTAMETLQKAANPFASSLNWVSAFFPALSATTPAPPVAEAGRDGVAHRVEELASRLDRIEAGVGGSAVATAADPSIDRLEERVGQLETTAPAAPAHRKTVSKARGGGANKGT